MTAARISAWARGDPGRTATYVFFVALAGLLTGYMFLGRGFARIPVGPVYLGEVVLLLGIAAVVIARPPIRLHWIHALLAIFMVWGAVRTIPYVPTYGLESLREATLWGYALFGIVISLLAGPRILRATAGWYGRVVPVFVWWVPVAWWIFGNLGDNLPRAPGAEIPILFFKNQDMAVHLTGAAAFVILGLVQWPLIRQLLVMTPLVFGLYVTWSYSRGAMVAAVGGLLGTFVLRPRPSAWAVMPIAVVLVAAFVFVNPAGYARPVEISTPTPVASLAPGVTPRPVPAETPLVPPPEDGRDTTVDQLGENISSLFGGSSDENLSGTMRFRLAWWREIVDYTVFGPYFWLGKGYGINLADDDGFQGTDLAVRAPHNSHLSVLARSGVPGLAMWLALQLGFGVTLFLAILHARRGGRTLLAGLGAWALVYWVVIMANTSFDPYIEGPQGGIWFWSIFGLGLAIIRVVREPEP